IQDFDVSCIELRNDSKGTLADRKTAGAPKFLAALALLLAGCQQKMASQPSYRPLEASSFFANGQSSRDLVPGTVARGHLELDDHLFTGRTAGTSTRAEAARTAKPLPQGKNVGAAAAGSPRAEFVDTFPFQITAEV